MITDNIHTKNPDWPTYLTVLFVSVNKLIKVQVILVVLDKGEVCVWLQMKTYIRVVGTTKLTVATVFHLDSTIPILCKPK